ncbi:MAG: hypothetical protein GY772_19420 [bacterium]|nr:hypothetical protein [bacterium]
MSSDAVRKAVGPAELVQTRPDPKLQDSSTGWPTVAVGASPETRAERRAREEPTVGDAWTKAVRDAISETVRLFDVTARYADQPDHPLRRIDAESDRQEVLLGTIGVLRQQGIACLPKLSEESLRCLMGSSLWAKIS